MNRKEQGFTLIELMIVVAIIAIIASIAIPNLLAARLASNESAAIATLRQLVSAQAQLQATAANDADADGTGEYGTFREMAAAVPLRNAVGSTLNPPVLSGAFGAGADVGGEYGVTRSGYIFRMFLPDDATPGVAILEDVATPVALDAAHANNQEVAWCAYAYPANVGSSGNRVFFVNQTGEILQYANNGAVIYGGSGAVAGTAAVHIDSTNCEAAFTDGTGAGEITVGTALTGAAPGTGADGENWTAVGN